MNDPWFERVAQGSATGRLMAAIDWTATPLGAPSTWPLALRTTVELCMSTRFPVLVTWGPELTKIYNDGYRPMLGATKHPGAMGASTRTVWADVWDDIGPSFEHVLRTGEPTWIEDQALLVDRNGFIEEVYFTYSYSPLRDDDGVVRGVLDIAAETTDQVVDRRRMRLVAALAAALQGVDGDLVALGRVTAEVLGEHNADVTAADLFLSTAPGRTHMLATTRSAGDTHAVPPSVVDEVVRTGAPTTLGRTLVAPLIAPGEPSEGAVVLHATARRPLDQRCRDFLALVATTIGSAVGATLRRAREVGALREVSDALQQSILPRGESSDGVAARYQPAAGNLAVGGDWYDVVDLSPDVRALVVGDCVGHGLQAATVMGQLRTAARTLLLEGNQPAETLEGLDEFARRLPGAECATVFCAVVDEGAGTVTYARAGHVPPLVLAGDDERWLLPGGGPPLTIATLARTESTVDLPPGSTLVAYTDGLVERRGEHLSTGLERLRRACRAALSRDPAAAHDVADGAPTPRPRVEHVADDLLRSLVPVSVTDDVALVVYQRPGALAPS